MKTSLLKYYGTFEVDGTVACLSNLSELHKWQGAATDEGDYWPLVDLEYKDPFVNICPFQSQLGGSFYIVLSARYRFLMYGDGDQLAIMEVYSIEENATYPTELELEFIQETSVIFENKETSVIVFDPLLDGNEVLDHPVNHQLINLPTGNYKVSYVKYDDEFIHLTGVYFVREGV